MKFKNVYKVKDHECDLSIEMHIMFLMNMIKTGKKLK